MRLRLFSPWAAGAVIALAGGLWRHESAARAELQVRTEALAREQRELARLQAERDHMRDELRATETSGGNFSAAPAMPSPSAPAVVPGWKSGEWTEATAWNNEGRATPRAAMATLLWAAAGGDLPAMRDVLLFDEATLAKARALFDSLSVASRLQYRTPEELVAGVTLGSIAPTRAQVSWLHQTDDNRAIVGMLLANPKVSGSPAKTLTYQPAEGGAPPGFRQSRSAYSVVVLNLQRAPDGWRIKVPAAAIDGMARWLRQPDVE